MLKNYLTIAFRNFWKNKGFTFINIFGLAIGIACSLLIYLFVTDERSYDKFHKDSENIYRVVKDFVMDDGSKLPDATSPAALAPAMQKEIPEVAVVTRIRPNWGTTYLIRIGDKIIQEDKIYRVDSSFFDVFTFPFIKGDPKTALKDVSSLILTESASKKFFGNTDPIGKDLSIDGWGVMKVTALMKDVPANAHFHFQVLASYRRLPAALDANWGGYNDYTYVKTKPAANITSMVRKIQDLYKRNDPGRATNIFYVQPVADIHLSSNLKWELEPNSDKLYVYVFSLIGLFIILIAGINYMNLATAKASVRAKEIGVRKVAGALRNSLVHQFLIESVITCLIASLFALGISALLLPVVNDLTGKQLLLFKDPLLFAYLFLAAIILGVFAGFFPALYLSSFRPIEVLKGFKLKETGALSLRKTLVVVQFTISIVLIIGALVISQQMNFIRSAKLGLNPEQVIVVNKGTNITNDSKHAYFNEIQKIPGVKKAAMSSGMVGTLNSTSRLRTRNSQNEQLVNFISVGPGFFEVLDIQIKEGRAFSEKFPSDTLTNGTFGPLDQSIGSIILNETAVKDLGIAAPVIGKQLVWGTDADTTYYVDIVGVTKDFHFTSFRNKIKPYAFINIPRSEGTFSMKLDAANITGTITKLENTWNRISPDKPFQYTFLDDTFAGLYDSERRFQKVFISLVILGIVIACLGLLGLATFAAQQRVKEIGIRKVLGASVAGIAGLLSKDFVRLVVVSFLIAIPIAWYSMNKWLQDFEYRIEISWWIFPVAGMIAILIALITISFQAVKAALSNPVKNLRTE
jgi:putative ABC transport system permease protein